jgi:hypothetical protein
VGLSAKRRITVGLSVNRRFTVGLAAGGVAAGCATAERLAAERLAVKWRTNVGLTVMRLTGGCVTARCGGGGRQCRVRCRRPRQGRDDGLRRRGGLIEQSVELGQGRVRGSEPSGNRAGHGSRAKPGHATAQWNGGSHRVVSESGTQRLQSTGEAD